MFSAFRYWDIPDDLISECCYVRYKEAMKQMSVVDELDKVMMSNKEASQLPVSLKNLLWKTMERPGASLASMIWLGVYMTFISLSIMEVCLSTMQRFRVVRYNKDGDNKNDSMLDHLINSELNTPLRILDTIGLVFFTIEPLVRLLVTTDMKQQLKQFLTILDILLAINHWFCFIMEQADSLLSHHRSARIVHAILRSLLSFRVLRIFHLARRVVKMKALFLTLKSSIGEIMLLFLGVSIAVIIFSTSIYYVEVMEGESNFRNIPQAIWWAIITMTTVGYGDYYPVSVGGYIVGTVCALSGLLLLSMPIAIIASNFNTYSHGLGARNQRERRQEVLRRCMTNTCSCNVVKNGPEMSDTSFKAYAPKYKTEEIYDQEDSDCSDTKDAQYAKGFRSSNHGHDWGAFDNSVRRQSDGAIRLMGFQENRRDLANQLLKPAVSDRALNRYQDAMVEKNTLCLARLSPNPSESKYSSDLPNWDGDSTTSTQPQDNHQSKIDHSDHEAAPEDEPPAEESPDLNSLNRVQSRSRKRKYRPRRKTWGSLSRLGQWTSKQSMLMHKTKDFKRLYDD